MIEKNLVYIAENSDYDAWNMLIQHYEVRREIQYNQYSTTYCLDHLLEATMFYHRCGAV